MKLISLIIFITIYTGVFMESSAQKNNSSTTWHVNGTGEIGGFKTVVFGNPKVVDTDSGKAVEFNGIDEGIIVKGNPIDGSEAFTLEVEFKPFSSENPDNREQRFVHIQNPNYEDKRILIELRLNPDQKWFLDTYIKCDTSALTHFAESFTHPADQWQHAALVYENRVMKHYVNGKLELTGNVEYNPIEGGNVSLGMRMNRVSFFKGQIRTLRFTRRALQQEELLK